MKDDINNATEAWLAEPFTQRMAKRLVQEEESALWALFQACRKSDDAKVTGALAIFEATQRHRVLFTKGEY